MKILALEPWNGGSHARLLEGWCRVSKHDIEVLGLPARHWKWRQAAGAHTLATRIAESERARPDALWVSDYVDVPQLRAFLPAAWRDVPILLYLHENQLTYPPSPDAQFTGDLGPAWSNLISILSADQVVFNSQFHQSDLRQAAEAWLRQLPRPRPLEALMKAIDSAVVVHPGIDAQAIEVGAGGDSPALRVVFNHRWEHDKRPDVALALLESALASGANLELVLIGDGSDSPPAHCQEALDRLGPYIIQQGRIPSRTGYHRLLGTCDLALSTAEHEFYGMAILETCAAGCTPLAPDRLAYPHTLPASKLPFPHYQTESQAIGSILSAAKDLGALRAMDHRIKMATIASDHDQSQSLVRLDECMTKLVSSA